MFVICVWFSGMEVIPMYIVHHKNMGDFLHDFHDGFQLKTPKAAVWMLNPVLLTARDMPF